MSTTPAVTASGLGLGGASFLVLLVLKVLGHIDMHWFWVLTSMLWVPVVAILGMCSLVFGCIGIFYAIVWAIDKIIKMWK